MTLRSFFLFFLCCTALCSTASFSFHALHLLHMHTCPGPLGSMLASALYHNHNTQPNSILLAPFCSVYNHYFRSVCSKSRSLVLRFPHLSSS